jgi:predicted Zn-dependent protease with MMP-like domain
MIRMAKKLSNQDELSRTASRVTKDIISRLPPELRSKLSAAAIVLQTRPDKHQIAEGIENDCLGLFTGPSLRDGDQGSPLPPQIILFLENIRAEAQDSGRSYREELRRTFLHELGHYLGLEEDDLALRDVD